MNGEGKMAGDGKGEGMGKGKHAAQPSPYWLGREFPGWLAAGRLGAGSEEGERSWGGIWCQAPGYWDWGGDWEWGTRWNPFGI